MKKKLCVLMTITCLLLFGLSVYAESTSKVEPFNGGTVQIGASYTNTLATGTTTYSQAGGTTYVTARAKVFTGVYDYRTVSQTGTYGAVAAYYALPGEAIVGVRTNHKVTYGAGAWTYNLYLGNNN